MSRERKGEGPILSTLRLRVKRAPMMGLKTKQSTTERPARREGQQVLQIHLLDHKPKLPEGSMLMALKTCRRLTRPCLKRVHPPSRRAFAALDGLAVRLWVHPSRKLHLRHLCQLRHCLHSRKKANLNR